MTNKTLIEKLRKFAGYDISPAYAAAMNQAADALEAQEWQIISTMPFGQSVLVRFSDGHIESQKRTETLKEFRESMRFHSGRQRKLTHWKPLPLPPEAE